MIKIDWRKAAKICSEFDDNGKRKRMEGGGIEGRFDGKDLFIDIYEKVNNKYCENEIIKKYFDY